MRACALFVTCATLLSSAAAATAAPQAITRDGWTVAADAGRGILAVSHRRLGVVLEDVHLNVRDDRGRLQPLAGWSIEQPDGTRLLVRTTQPPTVWILEPALDLLQISSTSPRAVITARAPAPADRIVARLLDPAGTPVNWTGTAEVQHGYGGSETRHQSYLPRLNPDVMYFALGQVSASMLHALFDRKSDTAIEFPDRTGLERTGADADNLHVTLPVYASTIIRLHPDYFATTLGVPFYTRFDDSRFRRPPAIWCSWTAYYAAVKEEDIVRNTDWLAEHLGPYGFDYVQIDDGYDRGPKGEHYWIDRWDEAKFPHGPKWLASYIKSKGLRPGLWLVPNAYAGALAEHPDWYVRDKEGGILRDYNTPTLDSTHPGVLAFLRTLFGTLRDWGFEYYKFDGEHAFPLYVPAADRSRLHDPAVDPLVAYRRRLGVIREAIGPDTFVEGCPAGTPLNGVGYFNSYFNGDDVYNNWPGMFALFSSINANAFWNHILAYVMPGEGIDVGVPMTVEEAEQKRPPDFVRVARSREGTLNGFGTTLAEARTLTTYVALTGVAYPLASVMPELPPERVALLKSTLPPMPILPIDLFSRGTDMRWDRFKNVRADDYIHNYPEVLDLKVNARSGVYDVVAVTNWRGERSRRDLSFAGTLGLARDGRFVVFDFWNQRLLGVFSDRLPLDVPPHDTRVVLVHPLQDHPQLVGISRHITGAHSVLDLAWDAPHRVLRGISQGVAGEAYSLFLRVPEGLAATRAHARGQDGPAVTLRRERTGQLLKVTFAGQEKPVDWSIEFGPAAR